MLSPADDGNSADVSRTKDGSDLAPEPLVGGLEVVADVPGLGQRQPRQLNRDFVEVGPGQGRDLGGVAGGDETGQSGTGDDVRGGGMGGHHGGDFSGQAVLVEDVVERAAGPASPRHGAGVALVAGWFLLPTSHHRDEAGFDPVGAALSVVGVTGLLYGFIQAPDDGWTAAQILAVFAVGVIGLVAFAGWERRHSHPMLDVAFFAERRLSIGSLSIAAAYFALFGMYFVFIQYLQLVRGYSPLAAGLYALPAGLAQFAVANLAKPLIVRYGFRPVLAGGLAASAAGSSSWPPSAPPRRSGSPRSASACSASGSD
jgi:hypothetical protein